MSDSEISPTVAYEGKYIEVFGARMHYYDEGVGDVYVFVHGNPSSSYLWRNVMPHVIPHGRCIFVDLIGMGKSEKLRDTDYTFFTQAKYLEGLIDALGIGEYNFVLHDWGGALGFYLAMKSQQRVKAIAFMEPVMFTQSWADFPSRWEGVFKLFRSSAFANWLFLGVFNLFINGIYQTLVTRKLTKEEKRQWAAPYPTIASRKAVRDWPRQIPLDGQPQDVHEAFEFFLDELQKSTIPKLLVHVSPGVNITADKLAWCRQHLQDLETRYVEVEGENSHYIQEDNPRGVGLALAEWMQAQDERSTNL